MERVLQQILDLVISKLWDWFSSKAVEQASDDAHNSLKRITNFHLSLKYLQKKLKSLSAKASDVKEEIKNAELSGRKKRKREVEEWLEEVESIEKEIFELGSQVENEGFITRLMDGGKVAKLSEEVENLIEQSRNFGELLLNVCGSKGETFLTNGMVGEAFSDKLERILELLENRKVSSIGVCGMGGHKKLQPLYHIRITPSLIRSGFFEMNPNIIKLVINYVDSQCIAVDLSRLHKLELLRCQSDPKRDGCCFLKKLIFPSKLTKLGLARCVIFGSFMKTLCGLPNLEVLKIFKCVFESEGDEEWKATEGDEFCSLQVLSLQSLRLVRWIAYQTNFPRLRHLIMRRCYELEEIPCAIGDIPTLQQIDIGECGDSVVASAKNFRRCSKMSTTTTSKCIDGSWFPAKRKQYVFRIV